MRPRVLRRRLAMAATVVVLTGTGVGHGIARADGLVDSVEAAYIATYGDVMVCATLDEFPTREGIAGVGSVVIGDGFAPDAAADIVNVSVATFCPWHLDLLDRVGAEARREGQVVA